MGILNETIGGVPIGTLLIGMGNCIDHRVVLEPMG
jgi:hypothetical protein